MKNLILNIEIESSKIKIIFIITDNLIKVNNEINLKHGFETSKGYCSYKSKKLEESEGLTILLKKENLIYITIQREKKVHKPINMSMITHEIYHCIGFLTNTFGLSTTEREEEYAYLNGRLNSYIISELVKAGENFCYEEHSSIKINQIKTKT